MINFADTRIVPRLQRHAAEISRWRYEGEYAFYTPAMPVEAVSPEQRTEEGEFAWIDRNGALLGHVSYGADGRIPTAEGYVYGEDHLDMGLGLRPDLCGRGLGEEFVKLCLAFARETYGAGRFRLSVAAFNARAIKVYKRVGFSLECEVTNSYFGNKFYIMTFSV